MDGSHQDLGAEREAVAGTARALAGAGLVKGTSGNLSVRREDRIAITPTGCSLADLEASDVCVVDRAGSVVGGTLAPTSELALHLGVYDRFGAGAVVHTHAPMATALACVLDELPCVHYEMLPLGGAIRVAPYRTFGTPELAEAALDALRDRNAVLLANHGALTHGADLAAAVRAMEVLEWAAGIYWHAAQLGTPRELGPEALDAVAHLVDTSGYGTTRPARAGD